VQIALSSELLLSKPQPKRNTTFWHQKPPYQELVSKRP
jgi:hypothetical protein